MPIIILIHALSYAYTDIRIPQSDGCIAYKTKQAILIAEYVQPAQAQEVSKIVEDLGDYLKQSGY